MREVCELLEWDSQFFGIRVARVVGDWLDQRRIADIDVWCRAAQVDCLYFLSGCDRYETTRLAEEYGFHLVDVRVSLVLERCGSGCDGYENVQRPSITIRPAKDSDIPILREIAQGSYQNSRFYYDEHFSRDRCAELYAVWIEKSCHGRADIVLVAEVADLAGPVGYVTCKMDQGDHTGEIDLVAVAEPAAGRGVGSSLLNAAKRWFQENDVVRVTVATQGRNIAAQRLYQRSGFLTHGVRLWYHRWFLR
jgi:dTDP-4-amino-4,6-dideoxy-D-galactose acyltransferase